VLDQKLLLNSEKGI